MTEHAEQMRAFIFLTQSSMLTEAEMQDDHQETSPAEPIAPIAPVALIADLDALVFKLRGFMETAGGEYALGVETGMQRAATMIENLVRRHSEGGSVE